MSGGRPPDALNDSGASARIKKILNDCDYEIGYEVNISGGAAGFMSAENIRDKNKIHIAYISDISRFEACVDYNARLETLSEKHGVKKSVIAVNGGYFAMMNNKIYSVGRICKDRKIYKNFIRHDAYPYFIVKKDGMPDILKASDFNKIKEGSGYKDYIQTKPLLVYNSLIPPSLKTHRAANESKNPRTAIAITDAKEILCMVVEGRQEFIEGMSQTQLADLLIKLGAVKAINLDGGGSSTIAFNSRIMNRPSGGFSPFVLPGRQRPIHSIIYFKEKFNQEQK